MSEELINSVQAMLKEETWTRATISNYTINNIKELANLLEKAKSEACTKEINEICTAIIGAKTEPIRYRKSVMLSMGYTIAAMVPMAVTISAAHFSGIFSEIETQETPAEYASKKVVVTVENTIIKRPTTPRPAFTIICAMSYSPV